jgi:hypothetical protein
MTPLAYSQARLGRTALVLLVLLCAIPAAAQQIQRGSPLADTLFQRLSGQIDLAVPDYPAFQILNVTPNSILRPSKLRNVEIAVEHFLDGGGVVPSSLAAELAPYGLVSGVQSLSSYQANHLLNTIRVSLGTTSGATGGRNFALGLRITPIDHTDLRMDTAFVNALYTNAAAQTQILTSCRAQVFRAANITPQQYVSLPPAQQASIDSLVNLCTQQAANGPTIAQLDTEIVTMRRALQEQLWNAEILDIGLAASGSSPDSLAQNAFSSGYALWATYAGPIGGSGQYMIGLNALSQRSSVLDTFRTVNFSLGGRLYVGSNALKGFIDFTGTGAVGLKGGDAPAGLTGSAQIGAEVRLLDGIWLDLNLGYEHTPGMPAQVVHTLNLRMAPLP